jgi:hypothetical protein
VSPSAFLTPWRSAALATILPPSMIETVARGHGHLRLRAGPAGEGCFVGETGRGDDARWMLGVLAPDRRRSIVVITADGELAVAVRDTVPSGVAVIRDARPDDAAEVAAACLPWPWMVVGATSSLTPALGAMLRTRPVLTLWLGPPPAGLPVHALGFDRPSALLTAVDRAGRANVGGMRLAPGSGVELHDGTLVRGATLDALLGAHPGGFALPSRTFRTAAIALSRHGAAWTPERDGNACVTLVPCVRAAARA